MHGVFFLSLDWNLIINLAGYRKCLDILFLVICSKELLCYRTFRYVLSVT